MPEQDAAIYHETDRNGPTEASASFPKVNKKNPQKNSFKSLLGLNTFESDHKPLRWITSEFHLKNPLLR